MAVGIRLRPLYLFRYVAIRSSSSNNKTKFLFIELTGDLGGRTAPTIDCDNFFSNQNTASLSHFFKIKKNAAVHFVQATLSVE